MAFSLHDTSLDETRVRHGDLKIIIFRSVLCNWYKHNIETKKSSLCRLSILQISSYNSKPLPSISELKCIYEQLLTHVLQNQN